MNLPLNNNYTPKSAMPNFDYDTVIKSINDRVAARQSGQQSAPPPALPRYNPLQGMQSQQEMLPTNTTAVDPALLPTTAQATPAPPNFPEFTNQPIGQGVFRSGPVFPGQYAVDTNDGTFLNSTRPQYDNPVWLARRKALLGGRPSELYEVDHIVPLWAGGTNDDSNLVVLPRFEHDKKTLAQEVGRVLLTNNKIDKNEALRIALTWNERDLSALPKKEDLSEGKFPDLTQAQKVYDVWKKQETDPTIGTSWIDTFKKRASLIKPLHSTAKLIEKVTNALPNFLEAGVEGGISGATAGYLKFEPNKEFSTIDNLVGNVAYGLGMILPIARVSKIIGASKYVPQISSAANTIKSSGLIGKAVGATQAAGNAVAGAQNALYRGTLATMGVKVAARPAINSVRQQAINKILANTAIKWTPATVVVGQLQAAMFEDENNNLAERGKQFANDLVLGGITGMIQPSLKGAAKVGFLSSMLTYVMSDGDWDSALSMGVTMAGLHRLGGIGFEGQITQQMEVIQKQMNDSMEQAVKSITPVSLATMKSYGADIPIAADGTIPEIPMTTVMVQQWRQTAEKGLIKQAFGEEAPDAATLNKKIEDGERLETKEMSWEDFVTEYNDIKAHGELLEYQTLSPAQQQDRAAENLFSLIEMNKEARQLRVLPPQLQTIFNQLPETVINKKIELDPADAGQGISGKTTTTGIAKNVNTSLRSSQEFIDAGENQIRTGILVRRDDIAPMIERLNGTPEFPFTDPNPRKILQLLTFHRKDGSVVVGDGAFVPQEKTLAEKNAANRGVQKGTQQPYDVSFNKDAIFDEMEKNKLQWVLVNIDDAGYYKPDYTTPNREKPFITFDLHGTHWKMSKDLQGEVTVRNQAIIDTKTTPELIDIAASASPDAPVAKQKVREKVKVPAKEIFDVEEATVGNPDNKVAAETTKTVLDRSNYVLQSNTPEEMIARYKESFGADMSPQQAADLFPQRNDMTVAKMVNALKESDDPFVRMLAKGVVEPVLSNPNYVKTKAGAVMPELRVTGASPEMAAVSIAPVSASKTKAPKVGKGNVTETTKLTLGTPSGKPSLRAASSAPVAAPGTTLTLVTATPNRLTYNPAEATAASNQKIKAAEKQLAESSNPKELVETMRKQAQAMSQAPGPTAPKKLTLGTPSGKPALGLTYQPPVAKPVATKKPVVATTDTPVKVIKSETTPTKAVETKPVAETAPVVEEKVFEPPKAKPRKARWNQTVITEKYKKGVYMPVAQLKLTPKQRKLFTVEGMREIAKEVSDNGRKLAGNFKTFKARVEKNMQEVLNDPEYKITDPQDIKDLTAQYIRLGKAATRKQLNKDGTISDGPLQMSSEIEMSIERYRQSNSLPDNSLTILHLERDASRAITKAVDDRDKLDDIVRHLQQKADETYVPFGLTKKGVGNVVWVKFEPKLVTKFNENPTRYKLDNEKRLDARDKFMRVFAVDVLNLPKDADAGNVLNKRSGLLFNRYSTYPGDDAEELVKMKILTSKKLSERIERPKETDYENPADPKVTKAIDSFMKGDVIDGQIFIGEDLFDSYVSGFGLSKKNQNSFKPIVSGVLPDGTRVTHKGVVMKLNPAIREHLKTEYGYEPGRNEFVSMNTNAKIGPKENEVMIRKGDVYAISKTTGGRASFGSSFERKFYSSDEGVTQATIDRVAKLKEKTVDYSNRLLRAKNQEEFTQVLQQLSEDRGVSIDTILNNEAFQYGASKITLEREVQKVLKNLYFGDFLEGKMKDSVSLYFAAPIPLKLDGPNKPARFPNNDELVIGKAIMKEKGLKQGDEVVVVRSPSIDINNMLVLKVRDGDALGHTSLGKEYSFMSAFNERARLQADQDGDTMSIFKTNGEDSLTPFHVAAIKKRGNGVVPFTEVQKIEGGYGPITYSSLTSAIKNQLVGDQQTGIIATASRIAETLVENKTKIVLGPGPEKTTSTGKQIITTNYKITSNGAVVDYGTLNKPYTKTESTIFEPAYTYKERQIRQQALQEAVDSKSSSDIVKTTGNNNPDWIYTVLFKDKQGNIPDTKTAVILREALDQKVQSLFKVIKKKEDFDSIEEVNTALLPYAEMLKKIKEAGGTLTPLQEKVLFIVDTPTVKISNELKVAADKNAAKAVEKTFKESLPPQSESYFDFIGFFMQKRADYFSAEPPGPAGMDVKERRREIRKSIAEEFTERLNNGDLSEDDIKNLAYYAATNDNANFSVRKKVKGDSGFNYIYRFQDMINADPTIARVYYPATESTASLVGEPGNNS